MTHLRGGVGELGVRSQRVADDDTRYGGVIAVFVAPVEAGHTLKHRNRWNRVMRMTISLEKRLAEQVHLEAAAQGISVSAVIARTLDDVLKRRKPASPPRPFRLITVGGGGSRPGIDLDRPRAIEAADDEGHAGR